MVTLDRTKNINGIKYPENLVPLVFRCSACGCMIRRLEETNSYILMTVHKDIEAGKKKLCPYCSRLNQYKGVEE
jgi:hypothetical protein